MKFQELWLIITFVYLTEINTKSSATSEKQNKNLNDQIDHISKATNAKPQGVKPETVYSFHLFHDKEKESQNMGENVKTLNATLHTIINQLRPIIKKDLEKNKSSVKPIDEERATGSNETGKHQGKRGTDTEGKMSPEKTSQNMTSQPGNLNQDHRYGTRSRINPPNIPTYNIPNNSGGLHSQPTERNSNVNKSLVSKDKSLSTNTFGVWMPSEKGPHARNFPNIPKANSLTTTTTMKTTPGISIYIRNTNSKDKTEGKILIPTEINFPTTDKSPGLPKDEKNLCHFHFCLCSSDMATVYCIDNSKMKNNIMSLQKKHMSKKVKTLLMKDFDVVDVEPQAFTGSPNLDTVTFMNIKSIRLQRESLFFDSKLDRNMKVKIRIQNCSIPQFPKDAFTQNVDGRHENRNIFSDDMRRYLSLEFINCTIGEMQTHSLHRALLYNFYMTKTKINLISPKAIDLDIDTLAKFESNDLPDLPTESICIHSDTVAFLKNQIRSLGNRSIIIETKGNIVFSGNTIEELQAEALAGLTASSKSYGPNIVFKNNVLKRIASKSFTFSRSFSETEQTISNNTFDIMCSCSITKDIEFITGTTLTKSPALKTVLVTSNCIENVSTSIMMITRFLSDECSPFPVVTVSAVSVAGILFIIAVTVCVVCSLRVQQVKEEANMLGECTSQSFSTLSRNYTDMIDQGQPCNETLPSSPFAVLPWGFAFPEVKTYQQNQVQEFTEQTESISGTIKDPIMNRRSEVMTKKAERASCPFN